MGWICFQWGQPCASFVNKIVVSASICFRCCKKELYKNTAWKMRDVFLSSPDMHLQKLIKLMFVKSHAFCVSGETSLNRKSTRRALQRWRFRKGVCWKFLVEICFPSVHNFHCIKETRFKKIVWELSPATQWGSHWQGRGSQCCSVWLPKEEVMRLQKPQPMSHSLSRFGFGSVILIHGGTAIAHFLVHFLLNFIHFSLQADAWEY